LLAHYERASAAHLEETRDRAQLAEMTTELGAVRDARKESTPPAKPPRARRGADLCSAA